MLRQKEIVEIFLKLRSFEIEISHSDVSICLSFAKHSQAEVKIAKQSYEARSDAGYDELRAATYIESCACYIICDLHTCLMHTTV